MSTFMQDLQRTNPALAADYYITGNRSRGNLRNMVRALSRMSYRNTEAENNRLFAAKRILSGVHER